MIPTNTLKEKTTKEPLSVKVLRWGIYATALIPLVIWNDYLSPFHFGKAVLFRSMVEIFAVLYLVLLIQYGKAILPPRTKLFWMVTLFTAVFGLATFTSVNAYQSFIGTLERIGGWFSFFHFWIFFVVATAVLRKKEHWINFLILSVWISLLSSVYGFLQKTDLRWVVGSGGRSKIFGTIGNPALFAGYIIVNAFIALMLSAVKTIKSTNRFLFLSIFLLNSLAILLTGVRGSVMGLLIGIFIFGFMYAVEFRSNTVKKMTLIFTVAILVLAGLLYLAKNTDFIRSNNYLARYADISPTAYTVQTRIWAWQAGFKGLFESARYVILGFGPENFNVPFSRHFNPKFYVGPGSETLFDRAHNQFIEVLITMGLIGFLAYIAIYYFAFKYLKSSSLSEDSIVPKNELIVYRIGLFSGLIAYIIHNSFIFDTTANYLMFFIVLGFINYLSIAKTKYQLPKLEITGKGSKMAISLAIGVVFSISAVFSIYEFEVKPTKANYTATRGIVASWVGNHELTVQKFQEALAHNGLGKYEIRHRFAQYLLEHYSGNKLNEKSVAEITYVIGEVTKNIDEYPRDYLPYLYIARAYLILGRNDSNSAYNDLALENSYKALKISPTFVRTYYELAQAYLNQKDYKKAADTFKKAVELNPEVAISWWYLGITQIELKENNEGAKSIKEALARGYQFGDNEQDILRLLNLYVNLNDYAIIADLHMRLVELKPNNPEYHASLASAYAKLGKIDEAVAEARIAASIDESFKNEAKLFVKNLGREF